MEKQIRDKVIQMFSSTFTINNEEVNCDKSIKEYYGLDSFEIIEFIIELENEMKITFEDDDLTEDNLYSINSIVEIIHKKINK